MGMATIPVPTRDAEGRWDLSAALALQRELRARVERKDRIGPVERVGGCDVAYDRLDENLFAGVVVLDAADLSVVEQATTESAVRFPYVPGFLSFREAPAILEAYSKLRRKPDLLLVDGHGWAHPRRFGIACHVGVLLDLPVVGVAKSLLVGKAGVPRPARGSRAPIVHRGERIGTVLRSRSGVAAVYVSVGHRVSLGTAVRWVLACGAGYRLPEPVRRAHHLVTVSRQGREAS